MGLCLLWVDVMSDELDKIREEYFAIKRAERKATEKKKVYRCSLCREPGHNRSQCSNSVWGGKYRFAKRSD